MSLFAWLRVSAVLLLVAINTLVHALPLFVAALFKALLPGKRLRQTCDAALTGLAESWIGANSAMIARFTPTRISAEGADGLRRDGHYLVLANHQSWVDILVLQKLFNRRIPLLRFFLKRQLFWVPVLGLAWWALDFPFMGRYTHRQIARNPELGRRDTEAMRRACRKFRDIPVSMMNFVEGTRFTPAKHARQDPPYRHLLKPRSGGVAFVVDAMGEGLHALLDVTIAYPAGRPTMVDMMAGRVPQVRVLVRERPIPPQLMAGSYQGDRAFRASFQQWMNGLWQQKDEDLARLLEDGAPTRDSRTGR